MARKIGRWIALFAAMIFAVLLLLRVAAAIRENGDGVPPALGHVVQTPLGGIYIEEIGPADGVPILLAHGSVGWSRMWRPTQIVLARLGYHAIAFDMPPMGYSERDTLADYSRQTQARRILALTEALRIRPILVAHSFGAGAASEAAMTAPQAFARLVVISGAIGLNAEPAALPLLLRPLWVRQMVISATVTNPLLYATLLKSFLYRKDVVTPALLTMLQEPNHRQGSTAELARWLPALLVPPQGAVSTSEPGWSHLAVPVAFIWGDKDNVTPLPQGQALAVLTGGKLIVLPEAGHIPQIESPDDFNRALIEALGIIRN